MSQRPFKILGIEHVGIAVESVEGISAIFSDILGLQFISSEDVKDQKVKTEIFNASNSKLEFLESTSPNSPISRFIEKKGGGIHHIALLVDHLQSALDYLANHGIRLINTKPVIGAEGYKVAFINPRSMGGILVELCEKKVSNK